MKNKLYKQNNFSLVELVVSMAVLSILIFASFTFFSTTQKTWSATSSKQEIFENARIALDLISKDLESSYYGEETNRAPFWHWMPVEVGENPSNPDAIPELPSSWGIYRNELLAFVSRSPIPPNDVCLSPLFEVKYQLYYSTTHDENEGWLRRSITGDIANDVADVKWNWLNNSTVGYTTDTTKVEIEGEEKDIPSAAFTADSKSSQDYRKFIPYVLDISFACDTDTETNSVIVPDQTISALPDSYQVNTQNPYYPTLITITITLMDRSSWSKWLSLCGDEVCHAPEYENEPSAAKTFRENNQMTFTRSVYLGNRGQP